MNSRSIRTPRGSKKSRGRHKCGKCSDQFSHMTKLSEHLKNVHGIERAFHCDECGKAFRSASNIKRHKLMHTGVKKFECDICNWSCNQKSNLEFHRRRHTKDYTYNCEMCPGKGFISKNEYDDHVLNVHIGKKIYNCELCDRTYGYKKNLTAHLRLHHSIINDEQMTVLKYNCKLCTRGFVNARSLKDHMKKRHGIVTQTKIRKFLCDLCGSTLSSNKALQAHRRIHTGEKIANCDICDKGFTTKEHLKIHRRIHTGEKPYRCNQCGKQFSQRTSLIVHLRYHNEERPYQCFECGKAFVTRNFLRIHRKTHSSEQLQETTMLHFAE